MKAWSELKWYGKIWRIVWILLTLFFVVALSYVIYFFSTYSRVPDWQKLEIDEPVANTSTGHSLNLVNTNTVALNKQYKALSYNIGFGAYTQDYSFFMDGGTKSWAASTKSVVDDVMNVGRFLNNVNADFVSVQEVDSDADRSYHVDQTTIIRNFLDDYTNVSAVIYNSKFLPWPPLEPHGASVSNIMTLSKYKPTSSLRRQLPIDQGLTKCLDLDRCYSKTRYSVSDGHELVYFTTHLSAYSKEPDTLNNQIQQLVSDMQEEYKKGNYCICGGDFNNQIVFDAEKYFPDKYFNTTEFPTEYLDNTNIRLVAPFNPSNPVGSCRDAGEPMSSTTKVCNIDGFIVSSNVEVVQTDVIDTNFVYSDHNPVYMNFKLVSGK